MPRNHDVAAEACAIVEQAGQLRWDTARQAGPQCQQALAALAARPSLLTELANRALERPGEGESFPCLDKLVLWRSPDNALRLRLHVFSRGYSDRPHNHRWSFATFIMAGSYLHTIYGSASDVLTAVRQSRQPRALWTGVHRPADGYFLDDEAVHSLRVDDMAVSLLLRGPAVKDRYFTIVPSQEPVPQGTQPCPRLAWDAGVDKESAAQQAAKRLTSAGAERILAALRQARVKREAIQ